MKTQKEAVVAGKKLVKILGPGWGYRVWENLGWWFEARYGKGELSVHESEGKFYCMLSEIPGVGNPGWYCDKSFRDPRKAVRETVRVAREKLEEKIKLVSIAQKGMYALTITKKDKE